MENASGAAFRWPLPFAHMFFPALSPDSVDNRITAFECAGTARRSRTTERSESVSEEAEECRKLIFSLGIGYDALFIQSALMSHS